MTRTTRTPRRTPWLRTHTDLIGHRKTADLADLLKIELVHAVGHLVTFWHHVLIHEEDGDLTGCRPRHIANWAAWKGDPIQFFEAMVEAGWLDRDGDRITVHDWMDYAGTLLGARERRTRYRNAKRDRDNQETSQGREKDVPGTSPECPGDAKVRSLEGEGEIEKEREKSTPPTPPWGNGAVAPGPKDRKPRPRQKTPVDPETKRWFLESFWPHYPLKTARQTALEAAAHVPPEDREAMLAGLKDQLAWPADANSGLNPARGKFNPHASTWINQRRWEDEKPATPPPRASPRRLPLVDDLRAQDYSKGFDDLEGT